MAYTVLMDIAVTQPRTGNTIRSPKIVRRRQQMRQNLINTAAQLFVEKGFSSVSVEEIIEFAGIARRTFYGFFANKNELLAAMINPIFDSAIAELKIIDKNRDGAIIPRIVNLYLALWAEHRSALLLLSSIDKDFFPYIETGHNKYTSYLKRILRRAEKKGELRNDSAIYTFRVITRVAVGMLKVYQDHPDHAALYADAMRSLLGKKS